LDKWLCAIQKLIDFIDDHAVDNPSLGEISKQAGYSPYYCSMMFHRVVGTTIKDYMAKRRLCMATMAVRDTKMRMIDIALDYGYSAQSALTRAFKEAYGCTPAAYRKNPIPIPLTMKKIIFPPLHYTRGDTAMSNLVSPFQMITFIPAHKYLGVYKRSAIKNGDIWPSHECDLLTGFVSSIQNGHPMVTAHTAGWAWENGKRNYFYGAGVESGYSGKIPEGFELRGEFEGSYYLSFGHPPFDFSTENGEAMKRVEDLAWNFDPKPDGWEWNDEKCQSYQCHYPEGIGYWVLRPVKKMK